MRNPFSKFENFGAICDFDTRKKIAQTIFDKLVAGSNLPEDSSIGYSNLETEYFSTPIEAILSDQLLKELTKNDPVLAETITMEILNFIHKTKRTLNAADNPFEEEVRILEKFTNTDQDQHKFHWRKTAVYLNETYETTEVDSNFYRKQFSKSFFTEESETEVLSFQSIREHLSEKWKELILLKLAKHQQVLMEKMQKKFSKELNDRMKDIKEFKEMINSFSEDFSGIFDLKDVEMNAADFEVLRHYNEILHRDMAVQELVKMLGKMRQADIDEEVDYYSAKIIKTDYTANHASKSDLIGIRESDDLNNLLPSETVLLSDPVLEMLFFKKFAEKKLQTFEFEDRVKDFELDENKAGKQKGKGLGKGPFIICVDTSGSMHGMPEIIAKTICLAILKIALKENRNCYLITFSTKIATLDMSNLKNSMDKIIKFLSMSFHGGTDASPALEEATKMLATNEFKKADVLMISDFEMPGIRPKVSKEIQAAKENKTKFHSLVIGAHQNKEVVNDFDHNWYYDPRKKDSIFQLAKDLKKL